MQQPMRTEPQLNSFLNRTLFVLLALIAACMCFLALEKFTTRYQIEINPREKVASLKQVSFARTPVLNTADLKIALLALTYHKDAHRRSIILRDLKTNQLLSLRLGEFTKQGIQVREIRESSVVLAYNGNLITMRLR